MQSQLDVGLCFFERVLFMYDFSYYLWFELFISHVFQKSIHEKTRDRSGVELAPLHLKSLRGIDFHEVVGARYLRTMKP